VINRTAEHQTDSAGKRLLREVLEPLGWTVNDKQDDYAIDANVQIFDGQSPTGAWFHVQLKSSASPDYSASRDFVSQRLELDHAKHFALELRQPVFLIVADTTAGKVFWTCPQTDNRLLDQLKPTNDSGTITVRVPTKNALPQTTSELLNELNRAEIALFLRGLANSSTAQFAESLDYAIDPETLRSSMQDKTDVLKLNKIAALFQQGDTEGACERADLLLHDPDANIETKFWASIQIGNIDVAAVMTSSQPQAEIAKTRLDHAIVLQKLTKNGPRPHKFYALVSRRAAELDSLAHKNFSLSMLLKAHLQIGGNIFLAWQVFAKRAALTRAITKKYNQCNRLARYAAQFSDPFLVGRALTNVLNALGVFVANLRLEGVSDQESAFVRSALQISKLAAWASKVTDDLPGLAMATLSSVIVVNSEETETYKWAKETAESIDDEKWRAEALQGLERGTRRWKGQKVEGDIGGDTVWQAVQNMATARGIDISDESSPLVKALRIAVKDDTPERVLKDCEHLLVSHGAVGPMAILVNDLLNIKTAGSKVVHCTLHNFHVEGKELDLAYARFKGEHCSKCKDRKPRPDGWTFSGRSTPEELDYLFKLIGTAWDMRYADED
jgi:hypothetical protein